MMQIDLRRQQRIRLLRHTTRPISKSSFVQTLISVSNPRKDRDDRSVCLDLASQQSSRKGKDLEL